MLEKNKGSIKIKTIKKLTRLTKLRVAFMLGALSLVPLTTAQAATPEDPFEDLNRSIYKLNRAFDRGIFRTVAYVYWAYTPKEFQSAVHNFFENWSQPVTIVNDVLQWKIGYAFHDTSRFVINSTFGLAGLFEVASYFGLEPRKEDFGQTLYAWGYHKSIYLMLPILGPSTVRDTIGFAIDSYFFDPISYIRPEHVSYTLSFARLFDRRVSLLESERLLENVGVDEYAVVRSFYLQKRQVSFCDGQLPESSDDSDPFAEPGFDTEAPKGEASKASDDSDPFAEPGFDTDDTANHAAHNKTKQPPTAKTDVKSDANTNTQTVVPQ